jgi:hypothetical protein
MLPRLLCPVRAASGTDRKTAPQARGRLINGRLGSGWGPGVELDSVFLEEGQACKPRSLDCSTSPRFT